MDYPLLVCRLIWQIKPLFWQKKGGFLNFLFRGLSFYGADCIICFRRINHLVVKNHLHSSSGVWEAVSRTGSYGSVREKRERHNRVGILGERTDRQGSQYCLHSPMEPPGPPSNRAHDKAVPQPDPPCSRVHTKLHLASPLCESYKKY